MQIKTKEQIDEFFEIVQKCSGNIYLRSEVGDCFNLKSTISQFVISKIMLCEETVDMELYCTDSNDEKLFYDFFKKYPDTSL